MASSDAPRGGVFLFSREVIVAFVNSLSLSLALCRGFDNLHPNRSDSLSRVGAKERECYENVNDTREYKLKLCNFTSLESLSRV